MHFSIIIPVYNRPDEVDELLESLVHQNYNQPYEIIIVEDGSNVKCDSIVEKFKAQLTIRYFFKPNSGPGNSRNFGMQQANGDYFIIFDSDCIIPKYYLSIVNSVLNENYTDCYGGPDKALDSFSDIQKAINFVMTSFFTTGGIRGGSEKIGKFQPRSFNMGISKRAFEASNGFGNIHPGEDPDLSIRLWKLGFQTQLIPNAFVYHKRRIDWSKFLTQVNKFGKARPILNSWYPEYAKLTFFFPTIFILGCIGSIVVLIFFTFYLPILVFLVYFISLFISSWWSNKSLKVASLSLIATFIQFYGYGIGFLKSFILVQILRRKPESALPELFFKK